MKSKHASKINNYRLAKSIYEWEEKARQARAEAIAQQPKQKVQTLTERMKEMLEEQKASGKFWTATPIRP